MAITNNLLVPSTLLTTSAVVLHTCPALTTERITQATICNTSNAVVTVNVYLKDDASAPNTASTIVINLSLSAYQTYQLYQLANHVLLAGYTIQALASTTSVVSIRVSGVVIV